MPSIYSDTNDGYIQSHQSSWNASRSAGTGTAVSSNDANTAYMFGTQEFAGRGRAAFRIIRSFFKFDTSGISVAPSSATLKIFNDSLAISDSIVVKSSQNVPLTTADIDAFPTGAVTALGNSDGSNGGTLAGVSGFIYSDSFPTDWDAGLPDGIYNDIVLNATARSDMSAFTVFRVCIMDYDYDFLDHAITFGDGGVWSGGHYADHSESAKRPYIDYTAGAAVAADNATFFGANF